MVGFTLCGRARVAADRRFGKWWCVPGVGDSPVAESSQGTAFNTATESAGDKTTRMDP